MNIEIMRPQTYAEFTDSFKDKLKYRLKGYSLELLDVGLLRDGDNFVLRGWTVRPMTQEIKDFSIHFGMDLSEDSSDAIDELCTSVCTELVKGMLRG